MKKIKLTPLLLSLFLIGCASNKTSISSESKQNSSLEDSSLSFSSSFESQVSESSSQESSSSSSSFVSSSSSTTDLYKVTIINGTCSDEYVAKGDTVTITANNPDNGYAFIGWQDENENIVSRDKTYEFAVESNVTLTAVFRIKDLTLTVTNGQGSGTYAKGQQVTISADKKDNGYVFDCWQDENDNPISNEEVYTFIINESRELKATYKLKDVVVTVYYGSGSGTYKYGDTVNLVANAPENGKTFSCWMSDSGDVLSREETYSFVVKEDISISAIFTTVFYDITIINGTSSLESAYYNQEVTISTQNIPGKTFKGWENKDGQIVSKENPYTFNVKGDVYLTAVFEDVNTIDFSAPENYEQLVKIISQSALVQNETNHIDYRFNNDDNATTELDITSYSNGLYGFGKGPTSSYGSAYDLKHILKVESGSLKEVKIFEGSSYNSYAKKSLIVSSNATENQINSSSASEFIGCYNMISEIYSLLNNFDAESKMTIASETNKFTVTLNKALNESSTMYAVYNMVLEFNAPDFYITKLDYSKKAYVIATQMENGVLKDNATARDNFETKYLCTRGNKEELPASNDVAPYFISDYDFEGKYYEGSTLRTFNRTNNKVAKGISIDMSRISIIDSTISPSTAIEKKNLSFVSSSNPQVIDLAPNSSSQLKTYSEGKATITVATTAGIEKSMEIEVCALAPASIVINSEDKVSVGERIELSVTVNPTSAFDNVTYSLSDNSIAMIESENDKTYLKGLKRGYVTVTATSNEDNSISVSKQCFVADGNMSIDEIKSLIVGKWYRKMSTYVDQGFTFDFRNDGTLIISDTYRGASAKISCEANWKISEKSDTEFTHNGTKTINLDEYYLIEVSNIEMTDSPAYWIDIHFLIAKDGSKFVYHLIPGSETTNTMSEVINKIDN